MVLDHVFPYDIRVEKECRTLVGGGHEVRLLSRLSEGMQAEEELDGITVVRRDFPPWQRRKWEAATYLWTGVFPRWRREVLDQVRQWSPDCLHVHDLPLVPAVVSVGEKMGIPVVADLHENYPEAYRWFRKRLIYRLFWSPERWERLSREWLPRVAEVVTVVEEARDHYLHRYGVAPHRLHIIRNTVDADRFRAIPVDGELIARYENRFVISYIGFFGPHRGIETLVKAMTIISREIQESVLLLVGSGWWFNKICKLVGKLGLENWVELTGWQDFSKVPSYVRATDVGVIPHLASGHTDTTIPHKLFQYMAMGKPVVVSSAKPLARIVQETGCGRVFPSGNPEALAQQIIDLYRNPAIALSLGVAGSKAVEKHYNWSWDGDKFLDLYSKKISQGSS
jgi:glycosyltransferase involved in cell wall biosynthesis